MELRTTGRISWPREALVLLQRGSSESALLDDLMPRLREITGYALKPVNVTNRLVKLAETDQQWRPIAAHFLSQYNTQLILTRHERRRLLDFASTHPYADASTIAAQGLDIAVAKIGGFPSYRTLTEQLHAKEGVLLSQHTDRLRRLLAKQEAVTLPVQFMLLRDIFSESNLVLVGNDGWGPAIKKYVVRHPPNLQTNQKIIVDEQYDQRIAQSLGGIVNKVHQYACNGSWDGVQLIEPRLETLVHDYVNSFAEPLAQRLYLRYEQGLSLDQIAEASDSRVSKAAVHSSIQTNLRQSKEERTSTYLALLEYVAGAERTLIEHLKMPIAQLQS